MSKQRERESAEAARQAREAIECATLNVIERVLEHAVSLRKNADGTWTASTIIIEGDRVVSREESKANFRAYGEQQFRIRAGKMFHEMETGRKAT